jgi:predicted Zn-dependent protease
MAYRNRKRIVLTAALFLGLSSCAQNPVTGESDFVLMSEAQELKVGREAADEVNKQYALYDSNGLQAYVEAVGGKLIKQSHRPALEYSFTVIDSPEINAFALPGGHVYITRGIIAYLNSEAEVAAVLGHEIGHVTARHAVRRLSVQRATEVGANIVGAIVPGIGSGLVEAMVGTLGKVLVAGYGRDNEIEADKLGAEYLALSGYDPQAMIRVIGVLKNQELFETEIAKQEGREAHFYHGVFATHPDNDTRLQEVVAAAQKTRFLRPADDREEFLKRSAGLVFGDSASLGIVRAGNYYHPTLGFAFTLPQGWRGRNETDRFVAAHPSADLQIQLVKLPKTQETPLEMLRRATRSADLQADTAPVNGLPAALSVQNNRLVALIQHGDAAYLFAATASRELFSANVDAMRASVRSFRAMTPQDRVASRAYRVKLVTAEEGASFAALAKGSPLGGNAEGFLRLLNARYPKGEPFGGQSIKVIE